MNFRTIDPCKVFGDACAFLGHFDYFLEPGCIAPAGLGDTRIDETFVVTLKNPRGTCHDLGVTPDSFSFTFPTQPQPGYSSSPLVTRIVVYSEPGCTGTRKVVKFNNTADGTHRSDCLDRTVMKQSKSLHLIAYIAGAGH